MGAVAFSLQERPSNFYYLRLNYPGAVTFRAANAKIAAPPVRTSPTTNNCILSIPITSFPGMAKAIAPIINANRIGH